MAAMVIDDIVGKTFEEFAEAYALLWSIFLPTGVILVNMRAEQRLRSLIIG